jgi:enamine deaminase RidA (YjgF/YER057c/UK114 family)
LNADSTNLTPSRHERGSLSAEGRLVELGLQLPEPPRPLGNYVEAVQSGSLLFLSGMLPIQDGVVPMSFRVGRELYVAARQDAARLAAMNALAVVRAHLGSLDRVSRVLRVAVSVVTFGNFQDHPAVADGASNLFQDVFGSEKNSCRSVYGVASLPLSAPLVLDVIFEIAA